MFDGLHEVGVDRQFDARGPVICIENDGENLVTDGARRVTHVGLSDEALDVVAVLQLTQGAVIGRLRHGHRHEIADGLGGQSALFAFKGIRGYKNSTILVLPVYRPAVYRPSSWHLDRCDRMIQNDSRDPNGGNVCYVTMQITLLTRKRPPIRYVICIVTSRRRRKQTHITAV